MPLYAALGWWAPKVLGTHPTPQIAVKSKVLKSPARADEKEYCHSLAEEAEAYREKDRSALEKYLGDFLVRPAPKH